ncbi:MAG: ATP-binding protein [Treponema sp.]|nr:ATP-binding protein [Treponema sp.]
MSDFYRRALKKQDKLTVEKYRELLCSAAGEISRLETVLNSIPVGILVCDENHSLVMANKSAQRLLPLNVREGGLLWSVIQDKRIVEFLRSILLNSDKVMDKELDIALGGQNRLLSISVVPLVWEHRVTGSLTYIEDITEKRKGESRLRRAENLASLTTLAAGVAHEIKNPLGSISIHLQLMRKSLSRKDDAAVQEGYFRVLNEEIDRLNKIVVDFLFAVRPMALELREGNLNALILDLIQFIRPEMEQGNIRCLPELDENIPPFLMDARYMKQALLNLVKNSEAAMPDGGLLTIATRRIDNEIKINVCDTGTGIGEDNLARIFEPYFTTKETGTGLGLTTVYKIIKEHQGEISVDSREGEGTNFEIVMPIPQKERRMIAYNEPDGGAQAVTASKGAKK